MKYSIERLPESRVAISVELEPERVEKALNRAARRISQKTRIPGFRPGKAPRYIIEARFGRGALYEEASDELIRQIYREILEQGEFDPIAEAELSDLSLEPFSFHLTVPVRPTVTLGDYRALRFPEEARPVTDEDVQAALERLQEEQTLWKAPDPPRPARSGDQLAADLVGRIDEREIEQQQNAEVVLGSETLLPGFSEGLVGAEAGQTVEVTVTLPEDLEDETLAGQTATYTVTVRSIKEPEVPELDDEFARSFGQEETLEEMRGRLRQKLEEAERKKTRNHVIEQMIEAIVEGSEIDMPAVLVEREADRLLEEQEAHLRGGPISLSQFITLLGKSEEEYREELRKSARERLRYSLVLQEVIDAEELADEEEELNLHVEERLLAIARGELAEMEEEKEDVEHMEAGAEDSPAADAEAVEEAKSDEPGGEESPTIDPQEVVSDQ